ncbi:hypothetical protein HJC23_012113 [Cyclotella cryptica]|uniref:Uncharacterized protein n=1 Tax=Cyclotella cryptica TaxID=29204 RepID=A0ABD3P7C5_9STRA
MRVYAMDPLSRQSMFYSSAEYEAFRTRAASDGYQLRRLLAACSSRNADTLRLLINRGVIAREDFLGVEHLISEQAGQRVPQERRAHSVSLLEMQKKLREKNELNADLLAEVAVATSAKSAQRARVRAVITE